jgi:hypothetical protein
MAELSSQPTSIQSLYGWYADDKLFVNRRYQRKLVWTLEEKQKLIESILRKYPIPAILLAEKLDSLGAFEIIDGLQRLHAIVSFIETSFDTIQGRHFDLKYFPTAKTRADENKFSPAVPKEVISSKEVTTMLDYSLAISIMRNATEAEINDVFGRINTYGHRLSDQERRQAGVQTEFSGLVRTLACSLRGDASAETLLLRSMPSISIDLPMTKHGYDIQAEEVFWVKQGILRSTDLRDSMDEQCIADIAACIIQGDLIERSKDALDEIYDSGTAASKSIGNALDAYGAEKFAAEFKFCIDELLKCCNDGGEEKLRGIIFSRRTTNPFPSVFAIIAIALHELIVAEKKAISDYAAVKRALKNIGDRIDTGRRATASGERRKNIDTIKGLIGGNFIAKAPPPTIYGSHSAIDIESLIRRSEIELSDYELKQGMLSLSDRKWSKGTLEKIVNTICAIANNGPDRTGKILIGVTDKSADSRRVEELDSIRARKVGKRYVVGVVREATSLNISVEQYAAKLKQGIRGSQLSGALKTAVLSHIDYNSFYGLGVVVISVPPQKEPSYVGDSMYWRNGDSTELASNSKIIAEIARRF